MAIDSTTAAGSVVTTDSTIAGLDSSSLIPASWTSDSLMASIRPAMEMGRKPVFTDIYKGHLLKPIHDGPVTRNNVTPLWVFPILVLVIIVFTWLRVFYTKYFSQMFQAFKNNNLTNQIVRDENMLIQRASVYLSFVFNIVVALFLFLISLHFDWELGGIGYGFSRFIFFAIVVSFVYTSKFLLLKLSGWLFDQDKEMATYIFNIFLINNVLGIALLPFILLLAYNQQIHAAFLINSCLILAGLAFIYRIYRGVLVGLYTLAFSPLYLFLYLCALEIAPLLILIRVVIQ